MTDPVRPWTECPICRGAGVFVTLVHVGVSDEVLNGVTATPKPCPTCAAHWAGVSQAVDAARGSGEGLREAAREYLTVTDENSVECVRRNMLPFSDPMKLKPDSIYRAREALRSALSRPAAPPTPPTDEQVEELANDLDWVRRDTICDNHETYEWSQHLARHLLSRYRLTPMTDDKGGK